MLQYTVKQFERLLKDNGYLLKRKGKGSHMIYSNGVNSIAVPVVELNSCIARRLIRTYNLQER